MTTLSDETLMFYADGLLDAAEMERVEKLVANDPALWARLRVFRVTGPELGDLFQDHMTAPVPARLRDVVIPQEAKSLGISRRYDWRGLPHIMDGLRNLHRPKILNFGPAFAAPLALIVGMMTGWLLHGEPPDKVAAVADLVRVESNTVVASGALQSVLETTPSGDQSTRSHSGGADYLLQVKMTFRNQGGDYCREYEIAATSRERYAGVACRIRGLWTIQLQALTPHARPGPDQSVPADGGSIAAIEGAISTMIDGNPLAGDDEAATMRKGWAN